MYRLWLKRYFRPSNYIRLLKLLKMYYYAYHACRRQWNTCELENIQAARLKAIISHAYKHVPFYRKQFDSHGIKPVHIQTRDDLVVLPTLSKQDLRIHFPELVANNVDLKKCTVNRTSGSTGEPTANLHDIWRWLYVHSDILRQRLACGIAFLEKFASLTPNSVSIEPKGPLFDYFHGGFHYVFDCGRFEKERDLLRRLGEYAPTVIYGAPSLIRPVASVVQQGGLSIRPKVVLTGFELLDRGTREYLSDVFQCEIIDVYGCSEAGEIAWECPEHSGYHINADTIIVEILRNGQRVAEGESGEIVVTSLYNYAMPLIRYQTGDIATYTNQPCPCGRKLPLLKDIQGRICDFILLPSGKKVSMHDMLPPMNQLGIAKFQIVQENESLVIIKFVQAGELPTKFLDNTKEDYRKILGEGVEIRFENVDDIPREASGKLRPVISKVHVDSRFDDFTNKK